LNLSAIWIPNISVSSKPNHFQITWMPVITKTLLIFLSCVVVAPHEGHLEDLFKQSGYLDN